MMAQQQKQPDPTKRVTNPRIGKLIELEVSGRIKPEHQQELDTYRAQGLAPKNDNSGTESERMAAFLATQVADETARLTDIGSEGNPSLSTEGAALFGRLGNYATPEARQRAKNAQINLLDAALTLGTGAAYTREQLEGKVKAYFPDIGESAQTIADKQDRLRVLLESARVKAGASAPLIDRALAAAGGPPRRASDTPKPGDGEIVNAKDARFTTDEDRGLTAQLQAAFDDGADRKQLDAMLPDGSDPFGPELDQAIKYRDNGGKGVQLIAPKTGARDQSALGAIAGSVASILPAADTPVGAALLGIGNAGTLGGTDELVGLAGGDAENFQALKETVRENNWKSDAVGNAIGAAGLMLGGEAVAGGLAARFGINRAIPAAAGYVPARSAALAPRLIAEDVAYGAGYGAGEFNDNRLAGAALGAGASGTGGVLGRFGIGTAARRAAPTGGKLAQIYAAGGLPTLGQRFGNTGLIGGSVNRVEEAMQSIPVLGAAVRGARQAPRDAWERGTFNAALGELEPFRSVSSTIPSKLPDNVELGTGPHTVMQTAFDEAYDAARSGMQFVPDAQYASDLAAFTAEVGNGVLNDQQANQVQKIIENAVGTRLNAQGNVLDGTAYKMASSEIMKASRTLSQNEPLVAAKLADYAAIFDGAARRSSSPEASALLDAADRGYAKAVRIEEAAAMRGANQEQGRLTPNQFDRAVQKTSGGVRSRAYLRGDALMGDYAEAGKLLNDQVPNSGTADRLGVMGLFGLGGAAATGGSLVGAAPAGAGLATLATVPYLPGVRNVTTSLLAPRNPTSAAGRKLTTLGRALKERQAAGGMVGAPLLGAPLVVDRAQ
jgi:hypothetical protein